MKKKFKNIFSSKVWLTILTIICILFIALTLFTDILTNPMQKAASKIIVPLQKGVNGIGLWLTEKSELLNSIEQLQADNKALQAQIDKLSEEKLLTLKDQVELEQLRELYQLDNAYSDYEKIGANVIARGSNNWYNTFTIDKGSSDGIKKDMNVIAGNGLVGIVTEVSEDYSIVRSIIDDSSKVSAMLLNTSDVCTVSGDLMLMEDGYIRLQYLDGSVTIKNGDMIVTSGTGGVYPQDLLIGKVVEVKFNAYDTSRYAVIEPYEDIANITAAAVITDF